VKDYVLTLLVTAAVTYMLTPLVRRLARRIGAIKEPRDRDVHTAAVPTIGGLAMYGGLAAGLLVADQIKQLREGFANTGMVSGLLLAGGLLVVVGIIDDRFGLSPLMKAAGQVAAGGILVATGTQLNWLPFPGGRTFLPTPPQSTVITILIVVATINAVNFIDGLDGLAAGIVAIAAVSFFLYYYSMTRVIDISSLAAPALASAVLIGMCLGFLPHNFSPASIFMGDTGSMLLGLLLAYAPISSIPSLDPAVLASHINRYPVILPLLLPAALLVIPYADLLLAVVRRTRAGQSPFAPDRKHLHHRLLDIGHSQRASVLIMYLWAAVFSGTVVWLSLQRTQQPGGSNHHGHPVVVFIAITGVAVIVLLLMSLPMLRQWGRSAREDEAQAQLEGTGRRGAVAGLGAGELEPAIAAAAELEPALAAAAEIEPVLAPAAELQPPDAAPEAARGSAEPQLVAAAAVSRMAPLYAPPPNGGSPGSLASPRPVASSESPGAVREWADSGWARRDWAGPDWTDPDLTNPDWGRRGGAAAPPAAPEAPHRGAADPKGTDGRAADSGTGAGGSWNGYPASLPATESAATDRRTGDETGSGAGHGGVQAGLSSAGSARSIIGTPPPAVSSFGAHAAPRADRPDSEGRDARPDEL
jgi:UDP-GlcNAc:undecaprenyl-phosphate/decaprenyl-phosphate GlcNAc-1-phosphate transferase